jgi:pimeloyl-ACP methyl ester carboxylesterase
MIVDTLRPAVAGMWSEVRATGSAAMRYRRVLELGALDSGLPDGWTERPRWRCAPVVLVHGAGHNATAWSSLARRLAVAGFVELHPVDYGIRDDARSIAVKIDRVVRALVRDGTAPRVHLVAHSFGGIAVRYWHDRLEGAARVDAAVTLGAPHAGTPWARLHAPLPAAHDSSPTSPLIRELANGAVNYDRWTTIGGALDVVVPPRCAHLPGSRSVDVPGVGHVGLLDASTAGGLVCAALLEAEEARAVVTRAERDQRSART